MRILQVIAGLHRVGGTTTFVGGLSNALVDRRHEVTIATFRERNREDECPLNDAVTVLPIKDVANHPSDFDVVHVHGLWDKDVFWATGWALKHGIPLIWSPHGMLAPWALKHRWWKKFLPWHLYLHRRLKRAAALHVTTPLESDWIRALGFSNRIAIVPLGTYLPPADSSYTRTIEQSEQSNNSRILLFVGRLHPVKGLDNLLDAWKTIPADSQWRLRLVGCGEDGYEAQLKQRVSDEHILHVEFVGAKYGDDLENEYRQATCLILPSFTENFGGVVVDALAHGVPVIASNKTPWRELEERHCGWWVDNSPDSLSHAILHLIDLTNNNPITPPLSISQSNTPNNLSIEHSEQSNTPNNRTILQEMGLHGRQLVEEKYTWDAVARQMEMVYNEAKGGEVVKR